MNEESTSVSVELTAEDYRRVLLWYHRWRLTGGIVFVGIFGLIIVAAAAVFSYDAATGSSPKWTMHLPILLPVGLVGAVTAITYLNVRRQARDISDATEPTVFNITDTTLTIESKSSSAETLLSKFVKVHETKYDFVFFPQKRLFYPLPKHAFSNESKIEALRGILVKSLGERAKIREES